MKIEPLKLASLSHHWTVRERYALVRTRGDGLGVVDVKASTALVIEDEALEDEVIRQMLASGLPVLDTLPLKSEGCAHEAGDGGWPFSEVACGKEPRGRVLMGIFISEAEIRFLHHRGTDAFENALAEQEVDFCSRSR